MAPPRRPFFICPQPPLAPTPEMDTPALPQSHKGLGYDPSSPMHACIPPLFFASSTGMRGWKGLLMASFPDNSSRRSWVVGFPSPYQLQGPTRLPRPQKQLQPPISHSAKGESEESAFSPSWARPQPHCRPQSAFWEWEIMAGAWPREKPACLFSFPSFPPSPAAPAVFSNPRVVVT